MTPRFRPRGRLRDLVDEVTRLRAQFVEQGIRSDAKDQAMRDYVNGRIDAWNAAMRALNGPRRGESQESYRARLLAANKRPG